MAAEKNTPEDSPGNLLEEMLERARVEYIKANGEEPPEDFMEDARDLILRNLAREGRKEHRDIYEALAEE